MKQYSKTNSQLVAHCFFTHGKVEYNNYDKYYVQEEEQYTLDRIKMKTNETPD